MDKAGLIEHIKSPRGKVIAVDLDGTLCYGEFWGEGEPKPRADMIELLWRLYKAGGHIIIYTARQPRHYPVTHAWLVKHEVPFHGIVMMAKPGAECYIDDKALHPDDILSHPDIVIIDEHGTKLKPDFIKHKSNG